MQDSFSTPFDRATRVEVSSSFRINNLMTNLRYLRNNGVTAEIVGNTVEITCTTYRMVKSQDKPAIRTATNSMTYVIKLDHLPPAHRSLLGL